MTTMLTIASSPAVRLYEIQYPAFGNRTILNIPPSGFGATSSPKTSLGVGAFFKSPLYVIIIAVTVLADP